MIALALLGCPKQREPIPQPTPVHRVVIPPPLQVEPRPNEVPTRAALLPGQRAPYVDEHGIATGLGITMSIAEESELSSERDVARELRIALTNAYDDQDEDAKAWWLRESELVEGIDYLDRDNRQLRPAIPISFGGGVVVGVLMVVGAGWALGQVAE